jgi:hypothetical protein
MSNNLLIRVIDCNGNPYQDKNVLFTPVNPPAISGSYLTVADSYHFTSSVSGTISASIVSQLYRVDVATPKPESYFYLNATETGSTVISASTVTGSSQYVVFNLIEFTKDPHDVRKVTLTPSNNYPVLFSGSIVCLSNTSSITDTSGSCHFSTVVPGVYQVDVVGKVTTTFNISVPTMISTGSIAPYHNAKDLIVVTPAKGTKVRLFDADNSYVLTVSSSDARYIRSTNYTASLATSASYSNNSTTASFVTSALTSTSASWASASISSSYANTATSAATASIALSSTSASYLSGSQIVLGNSIISSSVNNSIDIRNGTNSQSVFVYATYTDALNYERAMISWSANVLSIGNQNLGTGTSRETRLQGSLITLWNGGTKYGVLGSTVIPTSGLLNVNSSEVSVNGSTGFKISNYNAYTLSTNYERFEIGWSSNLCQIGTSTGSIGGSGRDLALMTANVSRWQISSLGHLSASLDNTYDFGSAGGNRARSIFAGTSLAAGSWTYAVGSISSTNDATNFQVAGGTAGGAGNILLYGGVEATTPAEIRFRQGTSVRWKVLTGTGDFIAGADNTYDIGTIASGGGRPKNIYAAGAVSASRVVLSGSGVTVDSPVIDVGQVWNGSGVTFNGIKSNVVDVASSATSKLIDLQVGGVSKFNVDKSGNVVFTGILSASFAATSSVAIKAVQSANATASLVATSSLFASASFSSSWASASINSMSSSYALTASYAANGGGASVSSSYSQVAFSATSASFASSSLTATSASWASASISSSYAASSSFSNVAGNAIIATFAFTTTTASYAATSSVAATASYVASASTAISASWAPTSISSSFATTASYASNPGRTGGLTMFYTNGGTAGQVPSTGQFTSQFVWDDINLNTTFNVHYTDRLGNSQFNLLGATLAIGDTIQVFEENGSGFMLFAITAKTDNTTYMTLTTLLKTSYALSTGQTNLGLSYTKKGTTGTNGSGYNSTSTTSIAIGGGSKVFTLNSSLNAYTTGSTVFIQDQANTANWLSGRVTAKSGTSLTVNVTSTGGSGTIASWYVNLNANGASSMPLPVQAAKLPVTSSARIDNGENGWRLLYDATSAQSASWQGMLPIDYVDNPTLRICYSMNATQTGATSVIWRANTYNPTLIKDVSGSIGQSVLYTSSLLTNQTAGLPIYEDIALTTAATEFTASNYFWLNLERCATASVDTATGDAEVMAIMLKYNK